MAQGGKGPGTFTINDARAEGGSPVRNHVVFMPISLPGGNYWSLAVATPEQQVLANMTSFRNTWLLVTFTAMGVVLALSFFLIRSRTLASEKKKTAAD